MALNVSASKANRWHTGAGYDLHVLRQRQLKADLAHLAPQ
jgi:hypothetical protein